LTAADVGTGLVEFLAVCEVLLEICHSRLFISWKSSSWADVSGHYQSSCFLFKTTSCSKSKLAQHAHEEGHRICWKEAKVLQIEANTIYRKYKDSTHSHLHSRYHSKEETTTPSSVYYVGKLVFLCWYHTENLSLQ
jgi:hypothetical protein